MPAVTSLQLLVESTGIAQTETLLRDMESRVANMAPAIPPLYQAFRTIERAHFDAEGPGWKALASSTVDNREYLGITGERPILNRSGNSKLYQKYYGRKGGELRRSLTTANAKYAVVRPGFNEIFMGTRDPVAHFHQEGEGNNPQRVLVNITEADAVLFAKIIQSYLVFGMFRVSIAKAGVG